MLSEIEMLSDDDNAPGVVRMWHRPPPAGGRPRRRLCHILTTLGVIGASSECPLGLLCRMTALAVAHGTTITFVC